MKYLAIAATVASIVPSTWAISMNTPVNVVQCQPTLLTWVDGTPPYYLTIIPGGQIAAQPLKTFDAQNGNSMTWVVDMPSGTSITFALKDNTGATAYSDKVSILPGSSSGCLNSSASAGSSGGSTGATSNAPPASTPGAGAVTSGMATTTGTSKPSNQSPASSARTTSAAQASASSVRTSAAQRSSVEAYGIAGLLGLVCAALL